jgi:hypothetical protein
MNNSQNDMGYNGAQTTLFSQEVFHANHTVPQESDLEMKMIATSGRRCLESYGRFARHGSWARTFSALLIGMEGWSSTKCRLTWKLKGTRYNRMYFQLQVSERPTDEIEYGLLPTIVANPSNRKLNEDGESVAENGQKWGVSIQQLANAGLLPTPTTQEPESDCELTANGRRMTKDGKDSHSLNLGRIARFLPTPRARDGVKGSDRALTLKDGKLVNMDKNGTTYGMTLEQAVMPRLLPTPTSVQRNHPDRVENLIKKGARNLMSRVNGAARPNSILDSIMFHQMLQTPTAQDFKRRGPNSKQQGLSNTENWANGMLPTPILKSSEQTGETSQLNPRFVAEMMGFPPNWLELPFLSTETSP